MTNDTGRSREACPVCGEHALHLLYFPDVGVTGARQYDDMLGFGDVKPDEPPGIGCEACGSEWLSLEEFREAQKNGSPEIGGPPKGGEPA